MHHPSSSQARFRLSLRLLLAIASVWYLMGVLYMTTNENNRRHTTEIGNQQEQDRFFFSQAPPQRKTTQNKDTRNYKKTTATTNKAVLHSLNKPKFSSTGAQEINKSSNTLALNANQKQEHADTSTVTDTPRGSVVQMTLVGNSTSKQTPPQQNSKLVKEEPQPPPKAFKESQEMNHTQEVVHAVASYPTNENGGVPGDDNDWCAQVTRARQGLSAMPFLQVSYPCAHLQPAKSAIVCVLTDGTTPRSTTETNKTISKLPSKTRLTSALKLRKPAIIFPLQDYINGVLALGASLVDNIDREQTHMLLLVREGMELSQQDKIRVEAVGWTMGTAPEFPLQEEYLPKYPRYKYTYSKLAGIGLAEYECVLSIDADALVLGDLQTDLMNCRKWFTQPQHRLVAGLDFAGNPGGWTMFNSGVILWKPSAQEMQRLFNLTCCSDDDSLFKMTSFSSDQAFLNAAYPERLDRNINRQIAAGNYTAVMEVAQSNKRGAGLIVPLPWEYNAQTHLEVMYKKYWKIHRPKTKILHFTQQKGWQCQERYQAFNETQLERAATCRVKDRSPICFCVEGHLWWNALAKAHKLVAKQNPQAPSRKATLKQENASALVTVDKVAPMGLVGDEEGEEDWCTQVRRARQKLASFPNLQISYPCEHLRPAKSAIVCVLTGGGDKGGDGENRKKKKIVFTAEDYIHGVLALGASLLLDKNINQNQTHMLLLAREGVQLSEEDTIRVQSVGWTIGTAPEFPLKEEFAPAFPRYKHVYTKLSVVGLEEYECVMIMDADTLVTGDMRDVMSCSMVLAKPQHRLAATLDFVGIPGHWVLFNSGVLLWKTETKELERLYNLTLDDSFMRLFSSDQAFLNNVYPERINQTKTMNRQIANGNTTGFEDGQVVALPFEYNAQTHVEVRNKKYWKAHRLDTRVLHFTERKGWQCPERYRPFQGIELQRTKKCTWKDKHQFCNCVEGYLWWKALSKAFNASSEVLVSETKASIGSPPNS